MFLEPVRSKCVYVFNLEKINILMYILLYYQSSNVTILVLYL